jgi:glycerol-3-phosphate cytidylyltransferase
LHNDPTINRSSKNKPIQSIEERRIIINSNKYVHSVIEYNTESDLYNILINLNPDLRMLGSDWKGKQYTGNELQIQIYFHERNHNWSTSNLRKRIFDAEYAKLLDIKEF